MKLKFYMPTTTDDIVGNFANYTINNPIVYQDILFYEKMYELLEVYFPEIKERETVYLEGTQTNTAQRYVFVAGEKAFAPSLASLPVFAVQRTSLPQINSEFNMGAAQIKDHRWYIHGKDSDNDPTYYYGRVVPTKLTYTIDAWTSSRTDLTKFALFYNDIFSQSGLVRGRISNISLQEYTSGTYTELPFFVKPGGNGVTENTELMMGNIDGNLNYATAYFDVDSFYLKINPTIPYTDLVIHWLIDYHLEDKMEVYSQETGEDITDEYRDYWWEILEDYDAESNPHEIIEDREVETYEDDIWSKENILKN